MSQCDVAFDKKKKMEVTVTYFSWSGDFVVSWTVFNGWTSYFVIVSVMWPLTENAGHSDLFFHGPVILPYILNNIWWMNIILLKNESVILS